MKKIFSLLMLLFVLGWSSVDGLLLDAAAAIDRFMAIPEEQIPAKLFKRSRAIAIVPGMLRGGFMVGARYGRGVMLFHKDDGNWSNPVFIKMYGGSFGWQIGVESVDVVLFFMNPDIFDDITGGKITLGVDLSVSVGPVGRNALAGTDLELSNKVYSYSRAKGAFIGAALAGSYIEPDSEYNRAFYGGKFVTKEEIFKKEYFDPNLQLLKEKLIEYSTW
jgi:lipid-binding SYLF domain-containing protein